MRNWWEIDKRNFIKSSTQLHASYNSWVRSPLVPSDKTGMQNTYGKIKLEERYFGEENENSKEIDNTR